MRSVDLLWKGGMFDIYLILEINCVVDFYRTSYLEIHRGTRKNSSGSLYTPVFSPIFSSRLHTLCISSDSFTAISLHLDLFFFRLYFFLIPHIFILIYRSAHFCCVLSYAIRQYYSFLCSALVLFDLMFI